MFADSGKCAQVRAVIPDIHSVLDRAVAGQKLASSFPGPLANSKHTANQGASAVAASAPSSAAADFVNIGLA
jgi:hypothetical protein